MYSSDVDEIGRDDSGYGGTEEPVTTTATIITRKTTIARIATNRFNLREDFPFPVYSAVLFGEPFMINTNRRIIFGDENALLLLLLMENHHREDRGICIF